MRTPGSKDTLLSETLCDQGLQFLLLVPHKLQFFSFLPFLCFHGSSHFHLDHLLGLSSCSCCCGLWLSYRCHLAGRMTRLLLLPWAHAQFSGCTSLTAATLQLCSLACWLPGSLQLGLLAARLCSCRSCQLAGCSTTSVAQCAHLPAMSVAHCAGCSAVTAAAGEPPSPLWLPA